MRNYVWQQVKQIENAQKALEQRGFDPETPWFITDVAGLQFYAAGARKLGGELAHAEGEEIQLVRRPSNEYDENAIEVWCSNGRVQCGHLPYRVAGRIAPLLDELKSINAICTKPFTGETWSMEVMVYGKDVPASYHSQALDIRVDDDSDWDLSEQEFERNAQKAERASGFGKWLRNMRAARMLNAVKAFFPDLIQVERNEPLSLEEITGGDMVKRKKYRGHDFDWWSGVPKNLKTKTTWAELGYKPKKKAKHYASISYETSRKSSSYKLYHARDVEPIKRNYTLQETIKRQELFEEIYRSLPKK